ncbi:anti-sigma factor domain-containing protein [Streptomyces sp. NPDC058646]|uniref:anti-sigma factor n=1 Tax=Streptomyces sp. NPDC058646 TaxID=3346574 RepID=UPI00365E1356
MKQHHNDIHTLTAAYALGALEPADRQAFTDHLQQCEACRQETAEFEATAARMAAAAAQAPPVSMKQHTMAAIDEVRQLPPRVPAVTPLAFRSVLRRKAGLLAVAASVAVAATFAGLAAWQNQERQELEQRARQAEHRLDDVSTVLAAPDARTAHGKTRNGAFTTVVASEQQNKAVFTVTGLPAPDPGKTYQLWLAHEGTMSPAGLVHQNGTVLVDGDLTGASALGLTLEPTGGSPQPTTTPLLLMNLPA